MSLPFSGKQGDVEHRPVDLLGGPLLTTVGGQRRKQMNIFISTKWICQEKKVIKDLKDEDS